MGDSRNNLTLTQASKLAFKDLSVMGNSLSPDLGGFSSFRDHLWNPLVQCRHALSLLSHAALLQIDVLCYRKGSGGLFVGVSLQTGIMFSAALRGMKFREKWRHWVRCFCSNNPCRTPPLSASHRQLIKRLMWLASHCAPHPKSLHEWTRCSNFRMQLQSGIFRHFLLFSM